MDLKLVKINKHKVNAIPLPDIDKRPIKGQDFCPDGECFVNVFLCGKKKSGKSSALFKMMRHCAGKDTHIVVFCSTLYKDKNWIQIRRYFLSHGIDFIGYTDIFEDGENKLQTLVDHLTDEAKEREQEKGTESDEEPHDDDKCERIFQMMGGKGDHLANDEASEDDRKRMKKSKYQTPEYIIVFDDLSHELKSPCVAKLLKENRHYLACCIASSQWIHDLPPQARKQLDVLILFKGLPLKKLEDIHEKQDLSIPFELFVRIYRKATEDQWGFLYIDLTNEKYRKNFNYEFVLPSSEN